MWGGSRKDIWSSGRAAEPHPPQGRGPEGGFQVELQGLCIWQDSGLGQGIRPPPLLVPELHGDLAYVPTLPWASVFPPVYNEKEGGGLVGAWRVWGLKRKLE